MSDLLTRGFEQGTVERLKAGARKSGRSMSAMARAMIERELDREEREDLFWGRVENLRGRIGRRFDDSTPYMAEAREHRNRSDNPDQMHEVNDVKRPHSRS